MTISKRDAKLLLILLGIIILLVGYLAVYNTYIDKTEAVEAEIDALTPTLQELQGYYQNLDAYRAGIEAAAETMEEELERYPTDVRAEDLIMYAVELQDRVGVEITGISFSSPEALSAFQTVGQDDDGNEIQRDLTAYHTGMTLNCALSYQALKDMIDYLVDTSHRTSLEAVSISFNSESGELIGTAAVNKYFVAGPDEDYEPTRVPKVSLGTDDIFSTFAPAATVAAD